jgi:hypothetical protein
MQRRGIEVRPVRPRECASFGVKGHRIEGGQVTERPEERPTQYRPKIHVLDGSIAEGDREPERPADGEAHNPMDRVEHGLPQWIDFDWRFARLQEFPVPLQLRAVNLRPGFDQPSLGLRQPPTQALDGVEREDGGVLLIVRMEMRPMMWVTRLYEHPNGDPEEP